MIIYQPFRGEKIQNQHIGISFFVISQNTNDMIKDVQNLNEILEFCISNKNHEIFSNENKKVVGKLNVDLSKHVLTDELICSRSKA